MISVDRLVFMIISPILLCNEIKHVFVDLLPVLVQIDCPDTHQVSLNFKLVIQLLLGCWIQEDPFTIFLKFVSGLQILKIGK